MITIQKLGTIIDEVGLIQEKNVLVTIDGNIITIGDTDHMTSAVTFFDDRIISNDGRWEVVF